MGGEGRTVLEAGQVVEEPQAAGLVGGGEFFQEQTPEEPREHAHGQEEAGPAGDPHEEQGHLLPRISGYSDGGSAAPHAGPPALRGDAPLPTRVS